MHCGKARYSRFEDLSDVYHYHGIDAEESILTENLPSLGTWALPNLFFIINTRVTEVRLPKWSLGSPHSDVLIKLETAAFVYKFKSQKLLLPSIIVWPR